LVVPDPIVSRQDLSDYLGKNVTNDAGALAAVDAASDMVRTLAEQTFNAGTSTITVDGTGTDAIVLPELPVSNVGTVQLLDSAGGTTAVTDFALKDNGVLLRQRGSVAEDLTAPPAWPIGRQNVRLTYVHGYGTADLPRDVRMVALSIASRLIVQGVASFEQMGNQQIRYGTNATDFTNGEKAILAKYRQIG
jgi:hypothetical protein